MRGHKGPVERSSCRGFDLLLGSFFVRYLFDRVETVEPFADDMKPATRFIG
ncbi:MAG TPA: hypothetical protein VLS93_07540 [Anaeromyxobacteraceae bacterium]|nr:hypothetical protein [Anaeromyxobacteraceae bacterium]